MNENVGEAMLQAFAALRERCGDRDPRTIAAKGRLVDMVVDKEEPGASELEARVLREVLDSDIAEKGETDSGTLISMFNLVVTLNRRKEFGEAAVLGMRCLELQRAQWSSTDIDLIDTVHVVATAMEGIKDYARACDLRRECYIGTRAVLGDRDPKTVSRAARFLDSAYYSHERADECDNLFPDILADHEETLGRDHRDTLQLVNRYVWYLVDTDRIDRAIELGLDNLERCRRVLGPDAIRTLNLQHDLAAALSTAEDYGKAEELACDYLERARRIGEPPQLVVHKVLEVLAVCAGHFGRTEEHRALLFEITEIRMARLGEEDEDTRRVICALEKMDMDE